MRMVFTNTVKDTQPDLQNGETKRLLTGQLGGSLKDSQKGLLFPSPTTPEQQNAQLGKLSTQPKAGGETVGAGRAGGWW